MDYGYSLVVSTFPICSDIWSGNRVISIYRNPAEKDTGLENDETFIAGSGIIIISAGISSIIEDETSRLFLGKKKIQLNS